jgi:hypothetical protein
MTDKQLGSYLLAIVRQLNQDLTEGEAHGDLLVRLTGTRDYLEGQARTLGVDWETPHE